MKTKAVNTIGGKYIICYNKFGQTVCAYYIAEENLTIDTSSST